MTGTPRRPLGARDGWASRRSAGGLQLFHRQSGINVLLDEARLLPSQWAAAPRYVSVALTNACDLRCRYCYAAKHPARLPTAALRHWLAELSTHECLGVGFGGGEPTLHPDFAALCQFTARETNMAVTFTTHAHRLRPALVAEIAGCVHFVRVSMDGVGSTYEGTRGRTFDALVRQLEVVRGFAPFGINVVVNAATVQELDMVVEVATAAGAHELLLLPERPTATTPGIDDTSSAQLAHWMSAYRGPIPLAISESAGASLPSTAPVPGETGLRAYAHVDATGVLKASSFDVDGVAISDAGIVDAFRTLHAHLLRDTA